MHRKSNENTLIYDISCKSFIGSKPLQIIFYKLDGFIRADGGSRYLISFGSEKYDAICNRTRYLISQKKGHYICFHSWLCKNKNLFTWSMSPEKTLAFHSVIILIK